MGGPAVTLQMPAEPLWLDADPAQLEKVCQHLLGHAAHIGEQARAIRVTTEREEANVVLRIREEGLGLAPETLPDGIDLSEPAEDPSLIDWGWQVGLGLVRRLVELHDGSVEVQSDGSNRGSEFIVRLPAAVKAGSKLTSPEQRSPKVLVVDDNVQIAHSLTLIFQDWGCQARMVHNGAAALEAVRAQHPDLVILDLSMPGMDGYEVARRLRQEQGANRLTLVALTGYTQGNERDRALRAGFDYHMVKPIELGSLKALVQEVQASA
jgi:CheY-like chemotaxis protein